MRGRDGDTRFWPLVENVHEDGILRTSRAPAANAPQAEAEEYGTRLLDELGYVGVLALELFDVGGALLANEFAPRVHNTGHWTIEGAATSQFENHLRAILGLPLGSTESRPSLLVNLIGSAAARPRTFSGSPARTSTSTARSRGRAASSATSRSSSRAPSALEDAVRALLASARGRRGRR